MSGQRAIAVKRRARHDYFVEESVEAGLVLTGSEVKSLRAEREELRASVEKLAGLLDRL